MTKIVHDPIPESRSIQSSKFYAHPVTMGLLTQLLTFLLVSGYHFLSPPTKLIQFALISFKPTHPRVSVSLTVTQIILYHSSGKAFQWPLRRRLRNIWLL